jgi:hypothetical protein
MKYNGLCRKPDIKLLQNYLKFSREVPDFSKFLIESEILFVLRYILLKINLIICIKS